MVFFWDAFFQMLSIGFGKPHKKVDIDTTSPKKNRFQDWTTPEKVFFSHQSWGVETAFKQLMDRVIQVKLCKTVRVFMNNYL